MNRSWFFNEQGHHLVRELGTGIGGTVDIPACAMALSSRVFKSLTVVWIMIRFSVVVCAPSNIQQVYLDLALSLDLITILCIYRLYKR